MKSGSKYKNVKVDGFDSKKEARFNATLEALRFAADPAERVVNIERQVRYLLIPSQQEKGRVIERPATYIADFRVTRADGSVTVYDVKGMKTDAYVLKRKLMLMVHGIRVQEV